MAVGSLNTNKDWKTLVDELEQVFRKWKIVDYDIPTKYKVVSQAQLTNGRKPAVTIRYMQGGKSRDFTCHHFYTAEQNLAAIIDIVDAVRKADHRGLAGLMAEISQHASLPAPKTPYEILGIQPGASEEQARVAWRAKLLTAHPDKGGSREAYDEVMAAGRALGVTD